MWGLRAAKCFAVLVGIGFLTCILAQVMPSVLVDNGKEVGFSEKTGFIGDTIGGTLGPFVALIASVLTYMAFKIQYDANIQQQKDLAKERFENKFFEMLRLHKECINEMVIPSFSSSTSFMKRTSGMGHIDLEESTTRVPSEIKGREVFTAFYEELVACYNICKEVMHFETFANPEEKRAYIIKASYILCFSGIGNNSVTKIDNSVSNDQENLRNLRSHLEKARVAQMRSSASGDFFLYRFPNGNIDIKLPLSFKIFSGHVTRIGHYYRNLFLMVKFVVQQDNDLLNYRDKREYLRILRAQLSNDEQLMLYFNYLSGYGDPWENRFNKFLSDYRMIHNLPIELTRFASDPREVFKEQINRIAASGEKMFEYDE